MGYTHYYYTKKEFDKETFKKVAKDFKKLLPVFEAYDIKLAGWNGNGKPVINGKLIRFNGLAKCGHKERDLGVTWPDDDAKGVSYANWETAVGNKMEEITEGNVATVLIGNPVEWAKHSDVSGVWFAGAKLKQRTCGGDCSHETFSLSVKNQRKEGIDDGDKVFCTKTAFKPYDLAVNCCLIIAKHYLGDDITVHSDGNIEHWKEGMFICQKLLGYGLDFVLDG